MKLFVDSESLGEHLDDELNIYSRLEQGPAGLPGRSAVRLLLDTFDVGGPDGKHRCPVHAPLWESAHAFLHRNPIGRLPPVMLAVSL